MRFSNDRYTLSACSLLEPMEPLSKGFAVSFLHQRYITKQKLMRGTVASRCVELMPNVANEDTRTMIPRFQKCRARWEKEDSDKRVHAECGEGHICFVSSVSVYKAG